MSAVAAVMERAGAPAGAGVLGRAMSRLGHRGPDGSDVDLVGNAGLGHAHFWTTPEEVGERQPLAPPGLPCRVALDGRIDNRDDLVSGLGLEPAEGRRLSDAALVLRAYERWGEACPARLLGDYALVIADDRRGEVLLARDPMGERTLFYGLDGARLVAASEAWAVAGASSASRPRLSEDAVLQYFALTVPTDGQTLFEGVRELRPGEVLTVSARAVRRSWSWQPDPGARSRGLSDDEHAERFREALGEAVRCRLRSATPVGVLMSGGLDSTSVASLAASMSAPGAVTTLSWVFDEVVDCDERPHIEVVRDRWGLRSLQIPGDDAWPLRDWGRWPHHPDRPEGNAYRLLKERAHRRATDEGLRVLLTGAFSDETYPPAADWLADLLVEGRLLEAGRHLAADVRRDGWSRGQAWKAARRVVRRAVEHLPGGCRWQREPTAPDWLTPDAAARWRELRAAQAAEPGARDPLWWSRAGRDASCEIGRHALELRHPFRDRRLFELVRSLPAHQVYRSGLHKHVLRAAMRGILPEAVRTCRWRTSLVPLFARGMEREGPTLQALLAAPDASWRRFVRADWLREQLGVRLTPRNDGPRALVPWLCLAFDAWHAVLFEAPTAR